MSKRNERREAERAARKLAYQESRQQPPVTAATVSVPVNESDLLERAQAFFEQPQTKTSSEAQYTANRANAQHSCGPKTPETKAISSRNHTIHGLTATVGDQPFKVLPGEDQFEYDNAHAAFAEEWKPITATETDLVERLAIHFWLRNRARRLQDERLAQGMQEAADFKQFEVYGRYYAMHLRAFNKAFADLMRLKSFQMRQGKEAAMLERRNKEAEIRFESQRQKSEAHAVKMETLNLKLAAQKLRNQRLQKTKAAAPAPKSPLRKPPDASFSARFVLFAPKLSNVAALHFLRQVIGRAPPQRQNRQRRILLARRRKRRSIRHKHILHIVHLVERISKRTVSDRHPSGRSSAHGSQTLLNPASLAGTAQFPLSPNAESPRPYRTSRSPCGVRSRQSDNRSSAWARRTYQRHSYRP